MKDASGIGKTGKLLVASLGFSLTLSPATAALISDPAVETDVFKKLHILQEATRSDTTLPREKLRLAQETDVSFCNVGGC